MLQTCDVWQPITEAVLVSSEDESWLKQARFKFSDDSDSDEAESAVNQAYLQAVAALKQVTAAKVRTQQTSSHAHTPCDSMLHCRQDRQDNQETDTVSQLRSLFCTHRCLLSGCTWRHCDFYICTICTLKTPLTLSHTFFAASHKVQSQTALLLQTLTQQPVCH